MTEYTDREPLAASTNPMEIDGIEFIEFTTARPQALGAVLERMGFCPVAKHRSREVELYRQGAMNIVINSQPADTPRASQPTDHPIISAIALRVRDAGLAFRRAMDLGCWEAPIRAQALELNIPGVHGVGESLIYFIDRYDEFSIYDIDFRTIPGVNKNPPALQNMQFFGVVQYIGVDRAEDWTQFYSQIFGFTTVPDDVRFGIMTKGRLLQSPCKKFFLQLIEPEGSAQFAPMEEHLQRIGLGAPDVLAAVETLEQRGIEFLDTDKVHSTLRGALTKSLLGGVMFELVHLDA